MTCPYCQTRPVLPNRRPGGHPAVHCGHPQCRTARKRETQRAGMQAYKRRQRAEPTRDDYRVERSDDIEAKFAAAKQARLARERATGQRTFTVGDGWQQAPGRSTLDGECRLVEVLA